MVTWHIKRHQSMAAAKHQYASVSSSIAARMAASAVDGMQRNSSIERDGIWRISCFMA